MPRSCTHFPPSTPPACSGVAASLSLIHLLIVAGARVWIAARTRAQRAWAWISDGSSVELVDETEVYRMALERYEAKVRDALEEFIAATNGRRRSNVVRMRRAA